MLRQKDLYFVASVGYVLARGAMIDLFFTLVLDSLEHEHLYYAL